MPRGGKREGAGRKPGQTPRARIQARANAADILASLDEHEAWQWAYKTARTQKDAKAVVDILKYLTDRRDGRAPQALHVGGPEGSNHIPIQVFTSIARPERKVVH